MNKLAEFYAKVMEDEAAKKEFLEVMGEKSMDELTDGEFGKLEELAKRIGFDITAEEAKSYLKSSEDFEEELSVDELDNAAGGVTVKHCVRDKDLFSESSYPTGKK